MLFKPRPAEENGQLTVDVPPVQIGTIAVILCGLVVLSISARMTQPLEAVIVHDPEPSALTPKASRMGRRGSKCLQSMPTLDMVPDSSNVGQ